MLEDILKAVSTSCLHGQRPPHALEVLWRAYEAGGRSLGEQLGIELLTSASRLEETYPPESPDPDIAANLRAHRRMFERLGFFARDNEGAFWAFHLDHLPADDAPVVRLDSEGQYDWLASSVPEALFRAANDAESMRVWLEHRLPLAEVGDVGASTQFLPSLKKLHERWYWEQRGEACPPPAPDAAEAATARHPLTWVLRPVSEVRPALNELLGLEPDSLPQQQWVDCDADGRVNTVWLHRTPATEAIVIRGVGYGMSEPEIVALLGPPTRQRKTWLRYDGDGRGLHFELVDGVVEKITLMVVDEWRRREK